MRRLSLFLTTLATACYAGTYDTKVVILGGGVSGIHAAINLTASGIHDIMLVEARDIQGGRAQDVPFADTHVELGCNWVQGLGTNPINQLSLKYKLRTALSNGDDVIFFNENGLVNATDRYNEFSSLFEKMSEMALQRFNNNQVDISGRTGLELVGWHPQNSLDDAIEYYFWDWELAETPELSSTIYAARNNEITYSTAFGPGSDGDKFVADPRGFKHIFLEEAKKVFKTDSDPRLLLNTVVTEIEYDEHGVKVHTNNGDLIRAEYAITTFSLGVLQHEDVTWTPRLPDWKLEGLYGFHMATYTKIFLNFPTKFWGDTQFVVWADPDRRGYFNAWQNLNKEGYLPTNSTSHIFFVTVTQDYAYQVEAMTDKEVQDEIMVVLRRMYGDNIPEPTDILFPRWHTNPLFRGSYSNWPIGELDEHHTNMKASLHNRVFFAGEAMSKEYYGFLQAAWFTGAEAALHVAQCIQGKCPPSEYYPVITNTELNPNIIRRSSTTTQ